MPSAAEEDGGDLYRALGLTRTATRTEVGGTVDDCLGGCFMNRHAVRRERGVTDDDDGDDDDVGSTGV